jgi:hypothetical protein
VRTSGNRFLELLITFNCEDALCYQLPFINTFPMPIRKQNSNLEQKATSTNSPSRQKTASDSGESENLEPSRLLLVSDPQSENEVPDILPNLGWLGHFQQNRGNPRPQLTRFPQPLGKDERQ